MNPILTPFAVIASSLALLVGISLAESGVGQRREGTSGRLPHLGDDIGISSDPQGLPASVTKPSIESPVGVRSHGEIEHGNRSSFGTPLPPNNLTPAPVLPFNPNRALSPAPALRNQPPSQGQGRFGH